MAERDWPPAVKSGWGVEFTATAEHWYKGLDARDTTRIARTINRVESLGPTLGRPDVDSIKGSRHHNMKELRSRGGSLRVLFAFDPERRAVLLVGGDKSRNWSGWYERNIPRADRLYDEHLRHTGKENPCHRSSQRAGRQSGPRSR